MKTRLHLAITACVVALIIVTTLGANDTTHPIFFVYRTLLVSIALLCTIGALREEYRISPAYFGVVVTLFLLMLVSVLRIGGSHFEGFVLWYRYASFGYAFVSLAIYAHYQSARWKGFLLLIPAAAGIAYLVPDILMRRSRVVGFSPNNPDYFATFLLIGVAIGSAGAIFDPNRRRQLMWAIAVGFMLYGIIRTDSRGATLASIAIFILAAKRAGKRVPRRVWLFVGLSGLLAAVVFGPSLIAKFLDFNKSNPYNYARLQIWRSSLNLIAEKPILGVGFGQFIHASKRFNFPLEGHIARYLIRAGIAHSEYLQHMAELGIPAAMLLFSVLGYSVYLAAKQSKAVEPEARWIHEAAVFVVTGVGVHALVDNCWTIPVTASSLVALSLGGSLPLVPRKAPLQWRPLRSAVVFVIIITVYIHSVAVPSLGFYYNQRGHEAAYRGDFKSAEQFHRTAIQIVPDDPEFLQDLGLLFMQFSKPAERTSLNSAREYLARAIAARPQSVELRIHMENALVESLSGEIHSDDDLQKTIIENDSQLLQIDPYLPFQRRNLATAYYNLGQRRRAFEELHRAIEYEPNYVPGYLTMAAWYAEHGDTAESRRYEALALSIVNKYRDVRPADIYEATLLGRPGVSGSKAKIVNHF